MHTGYWLIPGISALLLGSALALHGSREAPPGGAPPQAGGAAPSQGAAPSAPGAEAEVFQEWLAFGSGCRSRSTEPGDVTMRRELIERDGQRVHAARFTLDRYRLTGEGRPDDAPPAFARECAIRVQVATPPGKRIRRAIATTGVVSSKSPQAKLVLSGTLKLGMATLGKKLVAYDAGSAHGDKEDTFLLTPDEGALPQLGCGEHKLLGFDFTWIAERRDGTDQVSAQLSGGRELLLEVELEDCS